MSLLNAALAYANRGWPVFPLAPRSKQPLIAARNGGRGLHDATTNADVIREWWGAHPNANIGLRTGVAFDVVDVDAVLVGGEIDREWAVEFSYPLENPAIRYMDEGMHGPVVQTGHGVHRYVKPTGLGNRAALFQGVDYRGAGGYVVAPPSVHPNGPRYRWLSGESDEPGELPEWLAGLLDPPPPRDAPRRIQLPARGWGYGEAALVSELAKLSCAKEGTRNHQLNTSAFKLGQLVAIGELTYEDTTAALIATGQRLGLPLRDVNARWPVG